MGALTHAPTPIDHVHLQSSALPSGWDMIGVKRCCSTLIKPDSDIEPHRSSCLASRKGTGR